MIDDGACAHSDSRASREDLGPAALPRGCGRWCGAGCRKGVVPRLRPCYPADTMIGHAA